MCRSARLRNSTVIVVPDVSLKWKLMKQLLMLRLASPSLRADGMNPSCRYWDARVVIEKLWSMSELKKARPKGANLITFLIIKNELKVKKFKPLIFCAGGF